ncbi:hypothetical protein GMOD_00002861 [Pyrenophora seminiperda CCB06]|uniref:Uncharacterized protein n=1 Tax=Pyrenophora seminiperda CCB06 TaxID=1302712 RepID=A0A3M7M3J1_9PLEO|nr:hypothetical protein GMOD_00002861 [Pyrenophora seminiperda CCB06]
MLLVVLLP